MKTKNKKNTKIVEKTVLVSETTMKIVTDENSFSDLYFMFLIDSKSSGYDKPAAKKYALENWRDLNEHSKKCALWVFGKKALRAGYLSKPDSYWRGVARAESRILERQENIDC